MSQAYSVVMTGEIAEGFALDKVKGNVSKLLKLNDQQLDKVFSGKPVAIRRGIEKDKALKIHNALSKAGAIVKVKSVAPLVGKSKTSSQTAVNPSVAKDSGTEQASVSVPVQASVSEISSKEDVSAVSTQDSFSPAINCPRCGHQQSFVRSCGLCKMDLSLHIERLKRKELMRQKRQGN